MMGKKILYLFDAGDWESRIAVAQEAKDRGHDVVIGLINGNALDVSKAPGFKTVPISAKSLLRGAGRLVNSEKPDLMHVVTLKYSFIAGLSTMGRRDVRKIYTLAGLGYLFRGGEGDLKSRGLKMALTPFLKAVLKAKNTTLIFQNPDDLALTIRQGFSRAEHSVLIRGSGVHLDRFTPSDQLTDHPPIVLMPTRLVHEKGVGVFVEAARILKARGIDARFQIAGGETKHNPRAISRGEMEEMTKDGAAQWLGRVENMPDLLARAAVVVYPSWYGEGIPRVLLESCAAGKAIVTTDHAGCREAVDEGENGYLVPVRDARGTADAIERILGDDDLRHSMQRASRIKAEREFNIHDIVAQTVDVY